MADAIIGPLVGRLQELALSEARALVAVNDDIRRLRDKLMFLQAFLREADAKRHAFSDEITRVWLQQTRDAVFDAEDAVDHYYLQVDMSRYPPWARPCMRHVAIFTTQVRMRRSLSRKVKNINSRLEDILHNKDRYKMEDVNKKTDLTWKASTTISYTHKKLDYLHQPHHVIHVEEGKRLREVLTATEQELQNQGHRPVVITVYGKSGVGKTTLVRDKYEEMAKKKFFDVQAMESFAPYLTAINILQQIVQQLTEDNKNCPRRMVYKRLDEELKDKKYFLVIDGEVSSTDWKNILTSLPDGAKGSRIVHITQHKPEEPPSNCHHVIHLQSLEQDNTIQLFRKRLLHSEVQDEKLQGQYPHIHEITEGLPLAVVLLSGLVQTKEFPGEWDKVFDYLRSKQSKRLDSILSVCFDDLPHELKCCFLYFAALPSNITIEARSLVCMWMAEGFLRPRHGKTMEKVGYIYLNELIERNLVKSVDMDDVSSVGCEFVTIQNKVHDFLQFEAHEASFVEVHSEDDIPTLTSARRLSLQNYTDKYAALASSLPKLRSIISHFEQDPKVEDPIEHHTYPCCSPKYMGILKKKKDIKSHVRGLLHGSEFLRVINLRGIEIGEELPDEIGNVVHLQYLGITSCSLKKIPKSIGRLTSLQTLDVRETNVRELPLDFWTIKTLRHVFGFVLKLPKEMGGLKHLQTLDSIDLDACDQDLPRMLENMIHVEHLSVWFTGNKESVRFAGGNEKEFSASFSKLEHLRTLILHGGIIPSCVFTSHSLRRLKFMVLQGELPSQLKDMASCFPNLIILSLQETNVSQELISELANLPSLVTLVLSSCSHKDEEAQLVFSSAGFRYLKKLKIDVKVLMRVEMKVGALPKLEELDVYSHHTSCQHVIEMATFDRKKRSVLVNLLKKENVVLMI